MATATVVTAALAEEKIWIDKPSYDRAERQYFERVAKVMSRKVAGGCTLKSDNSLTNKCQDLISNTLKSKVEKSKDNKCALAVENESNENALKRTKCQARNAKVNRETADTQNKENIISEKFDNAKEKKSVFPSEKSKKYIAKEAKEKRNKEDTRNKNRGSGENDIGGNKETAMPFARNKEQLNSLSDQGTQQSTCPILPAGGSLANEVAKARQHIKQSLQCMDDIVALADVSNQDLASRVVNLEKDNQNLRNVIQDLRGVLEKLEERVQSLEYRVPYKAICPRKPGPSVEEVVYIEKVDVGNPEYDNMPHSRICPAKSKNVEEQALEKDDDDEDVDLFGSDSEGDDTEAAKIREERLAAYAAKKSKKPALIAKSNIILDVKPWDDETDMKEMENAVRKIETDGLLWGASKLVPLAFGIHKLQISCVVEDDKVSVDWLTEQIQDIEDYVQSVDIAAFNKV